MIKTINISARRQLRRDAQLCGGSRDHTVTLREPRYEVATTYMTIVAGKTVTVSQAESAPRA
jgi:hypothetical protein